MRISAHISFAEATKSPTAVLHGIDNTPPDEALRNMCVVAEKCFEPVRRMHGKPIGISSFFRCKKLNRVLKGSSTSDHMIGRAVDIDAHIFDNGITNRRIFSFLRNRGDFDQLIWEHGNENEPAWVHVSYRTKAINRKQVLRAIRDKKTKKTKYIPFDGPIE